MTAEHIHVDEFGRRWLRGRHADVCLEGSSRVFHAGRGVIIMAGGSLDRHVVVPMARARERVVYLEKERAAAAAKEFSVIKPEWYEDRAWEISEAIREAEAWLERSPNPDEAV